MKRVAKQVKKNVWRVFIELETADYVVGCAICLGLLCVIHMAFGA